MRHIFRNTVLALAVVLICAAAIWPPSENLRRGRDLAGGVSLVYSVNVPPGEDTASTIEQTIDVLKDRVDPQGTLEISFVRQGRNRIEVQMPLPSEAVKQLRQDYLDALEDLEAKRIEPDQLERVMRLPGDERAEAVERLADGSDERTQRLQAAVDAYEEAQAARARYEQARTEAELMPEPEDGAGPATGPDLDAMLDEAGRAAQRYQTARDAVLAMTVDPSELREALELSDDPMRLFDEATGEVAEFPSPRAQAMERIRESHPAAVEDINEVVRLHDRYEAQRRGLDDPNDLQRLLQGAGVLDFRITVSREDLGPTDDQQGAREAEIRQAFEERGPRSAPDGYRWFVIDDPAAWFDNVQEMRVLQSNPEGYYLQRYNAVVEARDGQYWMLLHDEPSLRLLSSGGDWNLARAFRTIDQQSGRPAIGFEMDAAGARRLGDLTGRNVGRQMAVVLDDRVYTAPNLQGRISSRGQITGSFAPRDIDYLVKTLAAGSLRARLSEEPISTSVLGPELGADNLKRGFQASVLALVLVAGFMAVYYFGHGLIAVLTLAINAIIILGAMALNRGSFTLPGIAGIVLTFGMAVDANVLIYERIREEILEGANLKTAVRLAYQKVLSTILDANITNFIVCLVLLYTATQEIKGFAITLMIGIVATLFSTLFVTRIVYAYLIDLWGLKRMRQAPEVIPFIQRALSPSINWLRLRPVFLVISLGYIGLGIAMIAIQGEKMLDNEFRGGTKVTVQLASDVGTRTRQEVEDRLADLPEEQGLPQAEILPENPEDDGVTSDRFVIKTVNQDREYVYDAVIRALGEWIDRRPSLTFADSGAESVAGAPVYPILDETLGASIARPELRNDVSDFEGGAAIVLENLSPQPTREGLRERLQDMRRKPGFSDLLRQRWEVVVTDGTNERVRSAALLVHDPDVDYFANEDQWRDEVAAPNWEMVREALTAETEFAGTESFSAQVAATRQAQAIVAVVLSLIFVMVYIWLRFGSLRYSAAAITALVHDVLAVVGLIALAEILYEHAQPLAVALMIEPFKIDLGLIAALLTIIGYSLNDTIIILDRIRENRGKLPYASADVVNLSINQTISRTVVTSGTTMLAVVVMYVLGGAGIRSFTYALICGIFVGTYSSVAVAAPLVFSRKKSGSGLPPRTGAPAEPAQAEETAPTPA